MIGRSLQASKQGIQLAKQALISKRLKQKDLIGFVCQSRQPISKFFTGKPVDREIFVGICERLGLKWEEIAEEGLSSPPTCLLQGEGRNSPPFLDEKASFFAIPPRRGDRGESGLDIDTLVQQVRQQRHDKIQYQCGTMRMLDISQPIAISDIYTDVNILEEIPSQQWREISDLVRDFNLESDNFDRLGLGKRQQRVPGLEAVSRYSKLMVLGKPGSGKSTFLQWVAIKCDLGEFQPNLVPIFIRLKNFADDTRKDDSKFRLLNYISEEFFSCGIAEKSIVEIVLNQGKALILLDGLDEVRGDDGDNILKQIRRFPETYFKNKLIITCRIAALKYYFHGFTNIEIEDTLLLPIAEIEKRRNKSAWKNS
ncbi:MULTISPECIES: NACHT domain-containing protein [unclassified Coleofasciculus]|uniref:NACHT domain-containing protein n=1 Tax=unclassified Coleofasciculus TaxID=2692782 RepID=UPI00187E543F|nr:MULTISPECIES: NACHT domain-containing protein [unclassified Coleofasciculus]MBE9128584.1 NACHT domain-containing protein [Coleofasciculus sp. LEGE 07081]MBE9147921.1 NACHT domain-containing protein [Coleofasciculus sp. LEGE 07092]